MPDIIDLSFRPCQPPFITPIIYWISLDIVHWWRRNSISFVSIKKKKKNYSKYPGDVLFPGRSLLFRKMTTLRFVKRGLLRCRNWLFAKHSVSDTIFGDQSVNNSVCRNIMGDIMTNRWLFGCFFSLLLSIRWFFDVRISKLMIWFSSIVNRTWTYKMR